MAIGGEGGLLNNYQDSGDTGGTDVQIQNESFALSAMHDLFDSESGDGCFPPLSPIIDIDLSSSVMDMDFRDEENNCSLFGNKIDEMKLINFLDSILDDSNLSLSVDLPDHPPYWCNPNDSNGQSSSPLSNSFKNVRDTVAPSSMPEPRTKRPRTSHPRPRLHLSALSKWTQSPLSAKGVSESISERKCLHCGSHRTPQWRRGPAGPKTLCNACGVRYNSGRLCDEYRPAASPTFVPSAHSNLHRKVVEMKKNAVYKAPTIMEL